MPARPVDPRFGRLMRALMTERGISYRALASRTYHSKSYLHELAAGLTQPRPDVAHRVDAALDAGGRLAELTPRLRPVGGDADAAELAHRITASDVSEETLSRLELAFDDLAVGYSTRPAADLVPLLDQHLGYVGRLFDVRKTLAQQRRLIVVGGWLSLLAATVNIDLQARALPGGHLATATHAAEQAEHPELLAWVLETKAWDALTDRDYRRAVDLSQQAQRIAPAGGSARIQATAQEGRAWARMGAVAETRDALGRVSELVSPLTAPARPEHHYRYDPTKATAYAATTLAWIGDPAAEDYARAAVDQLADDGRPRRSAMARLDLSLALVASRKPDEASAEAAGAIECGFLVASNWWRATEVLTAVEASGASEAAELRDAYESYRPDRK